MKKKQTVGWVYMIYEEAPLYCQIERGGPVLLTILERTSHLIDRVSLGGLCQSFFVLMS